MLNQAHTQFDRSTLIFVESSGAEVVTPKMAASMYVAIDFLLETSSSSEDEAENDINGLALLALSA